MLIVENKKFVDQKTNKEVVLKGVNLGGWLMMEGYILGGRNLPETEYKNKFKKINGEKELEDFVYSFRKNFVTEEDIKRIKELGFNCVRVPFHYSVVEKQFFWLEKVVEWCKKYGVYCILDFHGVKGAQSDDWHADAVGGKGKFWYEKKYQQVFYTIWKKISDKFKNEDIVASYDLMNEPGLKFKNWAKMLSQVFNNTIEIIRNNGDNHIIFLEGNNWATKFEFVEFLKYKDNIVLSAHFYHPIDYTFNFIRGLKYPNEEVNKQTLYNILVEYKNLSEKYNMPVYIGEFGINLRCDNGCYGEEKYLSDVINIFDELNFHWTIWCYKTIYISYYPTGLFVYNENPSFIQRQEINFAWERYIYVWKKEKNKIKDSWLTKNFSTGIIKFLKI
jgi:endoglucanase